MPQPDHETFDLQMMRIASRLAWRGLPGVKSNPPVGCIIVNPQTNQILGRGFHKHFGGPHAEINALNNCKQNNNNPQNATAYITLEPCNHHGKTPPCTSALINAGIKRVVIARRDPNTIASGNTKGGGIAKLRNENIQVDLLPCEEATQLTNPFVKVTTKYLPWIIVKWAQTLDGKIATRTGDSKWISNKQSRATVHRIRARADAILTGIGTVIADNPLLTARNTRRIRKFARRIVIDPALRIPQSAELITTADQFPTTIISSEHAINNNQSKANQLTKQNIDLLPITPNINTDNQNQHFNMTELMRTLQTRYQLTTILVEAGPRLIASLMNEPDLVDELIIYLAPKITGDPQAPSIINNRIINTISESQQYHLTRIRRMGPNDLELKYKLPE